MAVMQDFARLLSAAFLHRIVEPVGKNRLV
jgi:hypothetical protein